MELRHGCNRPSGRPPINVLEMLRKTYRAGASDLHIATGSPARIRVDGKLRAMDEAVLSDGDTRRLAYSVMTDKQKHQFEEKWEMDFSFEIRDLCRFRVNVFNQRGSVSAVFRVIPLEIKGFESLNLPPVVEMLCEKPRGLLLVTGPTGSGKSTTLAAMIDRINRERLEHILTIEDPIEFLHSNKNCIVNQREVRTDTHSFSEALRVALRQDPDVVLIGELRDLETVESALRIAETGHLTLATLHTNSAATTIHRIVDIFPSGQQTQIRAQLSMVLEGILCQSLIPGSGGSGRCMAMEILVPTAAVRNLIREDKIHQIYSSMQTGYNKHGMQTLNQSLSHLVSTGQIKMDDALDRSSNVDELRDLVKRGVCLNSNSARR